MGEFDRCCDPGTVWQGTPSGKEVTLGGLDAYIAVPASDQQTKGGILVINDVFGFKAKNIRLLTDRFAEAGYVAACPDYFHGDWLSKEKFGSSDFSLPEWLKAFPNDKARTYG